MNRTMLKCACIAAGILGFLASGARAEGVDVFGYMQSYYQHQFDLTSSTKKNTGSFNMQEMDLFVRKDLTSDVSCLIDLQTIDNFSQENNWGSINLDEAWIKFSPSKLFNLKVGKIVPTFNNFNEIKTKFPLMPYIFRPIVYESTYQSTLQVSLWVPAHAAIQINGTAPISDVKLDYAVYGGNSDFIVSQFQGLSTMVPGMDSTKFKMGGGRLGARYMGIKLGVSGTYDYSKHEDVNEIISKVNAAIAATPYPQLPTLPATPRGRVGVDLSYTGYGFTFEGEYIYVKEMLDDANKATLNSICATIPLYAGAALISSDLTKTFVYGNVMYDFWEKYFVSLGYSRLTNKSSLMLSSKGLDIVMAGAGYHFSDNITLKLQLGNVSNIFNTVALNSVNNLSTAIGISAAF